MEMFEYFRENFAKTDEISHIRESGMKLFLFNPSKYPQRLKSSMCVYCLSACSSWKGW
jgi:hypothetical protein